MPAKRDFLSVSDLSPSETRHLIQRAREMKEDGTFTFSSGAIEFADIQGFFDDQDTD